MTEAWQPCFECGVAPAAREAAELADRDYRNLTGLDRSPPDRPTFGTIGMHCMGGRQCHDRGHCGRCDLCLDWAFLGGLLGLRVPYYRTRFTRMRWVRVVGHWEVVPADDTSDTDTESEVSTGDTGLRPPGLAARWPAVGTGDVPVIGGGGAASPAVPVGNQGGEAQG
jgi:hypothetical protein